RHPIGVHCDQLPQRFQEQLFGQLRHGDPVRRTLEPAGVGVGAERSDRAVGLPVGLQTFENRLAVVQHGGGRVELQGVVRFHFRVMPAALTGPPDGHHVISEEPSKSRIRQYFLPAFRRSGIGMGNPGKRQRFSHAETVSRAYEQWKPDGRNSAFQLSSSILFGYELELCVIDPANDLASGLPLLAWQLTRNSPFPPRFPRTRWPLRWRR